MSLTTTKLEALQKQHTAHTAEFPITGGNRVGVKWENEDEDEDDAHGTTNRRR